jgi:hypothetical protein
MKKTRQQQLTRWLKTQSTLAQRWLRLSMLLGLISGMLIVAQAWLLAALLHALIIEQAPREQLIPSFIWLAATFALRAVLSWLRERVGFICGQVIRQRMRQQVLDKLQQLGPAWIQGKPAGQLGHASSSNRSRICRTTIPVIYRRCIWRYYYTAADPDYRVSYQLGGRHDSAGHRATDPPVYGVGRHGSRRC